jgi:hypothetical protein
MLSFSVPTAASGCAGMVHVEVEAVPHSPKSKLLRAAFTLQSEGRM